MGLGRPSQPGVSKLVDEIANTRVALTAESYRVELGTHHIAVAHVGRDRRNGTTHKDARLALREAFVPVLDLTLERLDVTHDRGVEKPGRRRLDLSPGFRDGTPPRDVAGPAATIDSRHLLVARHAVQDRVSGRRVDVVSAAAWGVVAERVGNHAPVVFEGLVAVITTANVNIQHNDAAGSRGNTRVRVREARPSSPDAVLVGRGLQVPMLDTRHLVP